MELRWKFVGRMRKNADSKIYERPKNNKFKLLLLLYIWLFYFWLFSQECLNQYVDVHQTSSLLLNTLILPRLLLNSNIEMENWLYACDLCCVCEAKYTRKNKDTQIESEFLDHTHNSHSKVNFYCISKMSVPEHPNT